MDCKYAELSRAVSVAEVIELTRQHVDSWSSEELERLPASCRPARLRGVQDIESWADRLVDLSRRAAMFIEDERRLDRLTSHFLIASVRIRQIALSR